MIGRAAAVARRSIGGACVGVTLALAGCGGGAPSTPPPAGSLPGAAAPVAAAETTPAASKPAALPKEPAPGPPLAPLSYDAKGRRDPFAPISLAKDKPGLSVLTLKLAGVIRGRTLLALVEAPDGLGYILKPGDTLGDGRVTDINQSSVTFAVAAKPGQAATTATLRLAQD